MSEVILHTESSLGFGGQEIRIIKEAKSLREQGYKIILAASPKARILEMMKSEGFTTYAVSFKKYNFIFSFFKLKKIIESEKVTIINSHSSKDSWVASLTAKILKILIIRTRHLSLPINPSYTTKLMYSYFVDLAITTCEETKKDIQKISHLDDSRCHSIATGINPIEMQASDEDVEAFRKKFDLKPSDFIVGTVCFLRKWKGIDTFIETAKIFKDDPHLKWLIVGTGISEKLFREKTKKLGLEDKIIFTGHMNNPSIALKTFDVFTLLSTNSEGISQAHLQSAYLKKPSITTAVGGLKEVCIPGSTGFIVNKNSPKEVKEAILNLQDPALRTKLGINAYDLVTKNFMWETTIEKTKAIYRDLTLMGKLK